MEKSVLTFSHANGNIEGLYINAGANSPLVIIINGHNGFYSYGMFPYIQQQLSQEGISSFSFNFSHGGVQGDRDYFQELDKYEKNCMRLELEDSVCAIQNLSAQNIYQHENIFILAHSLGGVPAVFAALLSQKNHINLSGMVLLSTVKKLNFWPDEMIEEWKENKIFYKKNNRTNQLLPQGYEFLQEVLSADDNWNLEQALQSLKIPVLLIHGDNDEAIPAEHSEAKYSWIKAGNEGASLKIIPGGTHTFNTRHPFAGTSPQLENVLKETAKFILNNSR